MSEVKIAVTIEPENEISQTFKQLVNIKHLSI